MRIAWFLLSGLCHQLPEHSLTFGGLPLPLCARCTGLFTGAALTFLILWAVDRGRTGGLDGRLAALMGLLGAAWLVDGVNSLGSFWRSRPFLYPPSNALRLATGLGMGFAVGTLLYIVSQSIRAAEAEAHRASPGRLWVPLAANIAWGALLWGWRSAPYGCFFWAVALAACGTLALVNAPLWAVLLGEARRRGRWGAFGLPLALGLLSALAEMALVGGLRTLLGA